MNFDYDDYIGGVKLAIISQVSAKLVSSLISYLPFLGWGPLAPVLGLLAKRLMEFIVNKTELSIFLAYVDMRVDDQASDFNEAVVINLQAQKNGSKEEQIRAEENLKNKFRDFIKLVS